MRLFAALRVTQQRSTIVREETLRYAQSDKMLSFLRHHLFVILELPFSVVLNRLCEEPR